MKFLDRFCTWQSEENVCPRGVVVASDHVQEWLLPWWWERFSSCNTLPVAFIDYGMSEKARLWCKQKGMVIALKQELSDWDPSPSDSDNWKMWEEVYGSSYKRARKSWFKKPFACLHTPFQTTVWMDLDCEVLLPIDEIFNCGLDFVVAEERATAYLELSHPDKRFNSGVLVFSKGSKVIPIWAQHAFLYADQFWGDDHVLSSLLQTGLYSFSSLPYVYHWTISQYGVPVEAKIIHWLGEWGKAYIRKYGGLKSTLLQFPVFHS